MTKPGRNAPCACGSGKKYKHCCLLREKAATVHDGATAPQATQSALLRAALQHHHAGRLADAEAAYRQILQQSPNHPDALHFLGMIAYQAGRNDVAADLIRRALAVRPDYAEAHNNLGVILSRLGAHDDAAASFRNAVAAKPDFAEAHNNLGGALFKSGKLDESIGCYRRAIALRPGYAEASKNLADALARIGQPDAAETHYREAIARNPDYAEAHRNLGGVLFGQGKHNEAIACYRNALRIEPADEVSQHMVAALSGGRAEHAPGGYVSGVFDDYAERFDTHLANDLGYDIPARMVAQLRERATVTDRKWDVLDLGCGTGLVGAAIAADARQLVGVDLSSGMLDKARAKNVYARLEHRELIAMMQTEPAGGYDVITAADVFIYVGKVDEVVGEAARLLRNGGLFAFSIEDLDSAQGAALAPGGERDYALTTTGRFAHAPAYLNRLAAARGFRVVTMDPAQIRIEKGVPVKGWLVLLQK